MKEIGNPNNVNHFIVFSESDVQRLSISDNPIAQSTALKYKLESAKNHGKGETTLTIGDEGLEMIKEILA